MIALSFSVLETGQFEVYAMAQAQHKRPSSVDMGDGDCGLKEGSAASPRSAAAAKDVTDIVDIQTAKDIAVKRRQERRQQLDDIDEEDALEGEPSSKRRPPPQLAIKRAASTPVGPARTSPPLKKAAFTGGL